MGAGQCWLSLKRSRLTLVRVSLPRVKVGRAFGIPAIAIAALSILACSQQVEAPTEQPATPTPAVLREADPTVEKVEPAPSPTPTSSPTPTATPVPPTPSPTPVPTPTPREQLATTDEANLWIYIERATSTGIRWSVYADPGFDIDAFDLEVFIDSRAYCNTATILADFGPLELSCEIYEHRGPPKVYALYVPRKQEPLICEKNKQTAGNRYVYACYWKDEVPVAATPTPDYQAIVAFIDSLHDVQEADLWIKVIGVHIESVISWRVHASSAESIAVNRLAVSIDEQTFCNREWVWGELGGDATLPEGEGTRLACSSYAPTDEPIVTAAIDRGGLEGPLFLLCGRHDASDPDNRLFVYACRYEDGLLPT